VKEIRIVIAPHVLSQKKYDAAKVQKLQALLADHRGFMQNRLGSFVGRQQELAVIQQCISAKMTTGGYVTITGQAGQGKSSIIARLVEQYGLDTTAFHFIPLSPGPDHQVGLLRNLMARLILKYDLSDLYVASDNRAALRDYFPKVLRDVVVAGGQEVIFIDGLDQLEEDLNGVRDLSFLPTNLPPGIVFVLGTRPNDTLQPLQLLSPLEEYRLPDMSRQDFDLILAHRGVQLESVLADRFYQMVEQNALYLDLAAKELVEAGQISPDELIARLAHNPGNLFSLSITRFKRQSSEWREVLRPILGLLLAAREPLGLHSMSTILNIEDDRLRDGIRCLGGLLTDTGQQRYALYHLKLRNYLKHDEQAPQKEYVFASDEEKYYHARIAAWCEQGSPSLIWVDVKEPTEQERRVYARKHLIAHFYFADQWERLFAILDDGSYGRAKERYDVSTRSYLQDLDFGRRAAAWDSWTQEQVLTYLPRLWQYTLLRCKLRSRSDNYPDELLLLMLLLGREQEVLGHVELLTDPVRKTTTLQMVAEYLATQSGRQAECEQLFCRVHDLARSIEAPDKQVERLRSLTKTLAEVQNWELAEKVARSIIKIEMQALALIELGSSLARAQNWERAERVWRQVEEITRSISEPDKRDKVLKELDRVQMRKLINREYSIITGANQAKAWVDLANQFAGVQTWEQAGKIVRSIIKDNMRAGVWGELIAALVKVQRHKLAKIVHIKTEEIVRSLTESDEQANALRKLANWQAKAQRWGQVEDVRYSIARCGGCTGPLREFVANWQSEAQNWEQIEEVVLSIKDDYRQAAVLSMLAEALTKAQSWEQAEKVACSIKGRYQRAIALSELAEALTHIQGWKQAEPLWKQVEEVARAIKDSYQQAHALRELVRALAHVQRWEQAEVIMHSIKDSYIQVNALQSLVESLLMHGHHERVISLVQRSWLRAETKTFALQIFSAVIPGLLALQPEQGIAFYQAFQWVDAFLCGEIVEPLE
jgi:hypothetical protein